MLPFVFIVFVYFVHALVSLVVKKKQVACLRYAIIFLTCFSTKLISLRDKEVLFWD